MGVLLTGDLHGEGEIGRLDQANLRRQGIDPETVDYLIVLGDWGVLWNDGHASVKVERELLKDFDDMPWETLVVLGNHEGYDRIERLPVVNRHGAPVRQVTSKVFLLEHGNLYTIDGKRFFVFGGAASIDRKNRLEGQSWWPQEIPSPEDLQRGLRTLATLAQPPHYILTHTCPSRVFQYMLAEGLMEFGDPKIQDPTVPMLDQLESLLPEPPLGWYFGHYHIDLDWEHYHCRFDKMQLI